MQFRKFWILGSIVLLAGCAQNETIFRGESANWTATYTQVLTSKTEGVEDLSLTYQGSEASVHNIKYSLEGGRVKASGEMKDLTGPIGGRSGGTTHPLDKKLTLTMKVEWNGKTETFDLNAK